MDMMLPFVIPLMAGHTVLLAVRSEQRDPKCAAPRLYRLEYLERFAEDGIGKSIVFYSKSDKPSDKAGYISTFTLVIE